MALNQATNWDMSSATAYWAAINGRQWQTCGTNSTTTATAWTTFARNSTAVTSWKGASAGSGLAVGGYTWQIFTVPGTGTQHVAGRFAYSTNIGTGASSWARVDVFSPDGTFRGTLGCVTFTATTATTTLATTYIDLTGGTTYRLSITEHGATTSGGSGKFSTIFVTNVIANTPPVGMGISLDGSNHPALTWTASTATTTAPGINATTPYKVYRGTSSGSETFLANSSTNSYTDSAVSNNTTYFYWVTNMDTNSFESGSSTEVSITTNGPPTVSTDVETNVDNTSATMNGTISATGGSNSTSRGFAWGTNSNLSGGDTSTTTESGSFGTSSFTQNISNLLSNTTYYYRAYSTNTIGTGYGSTIESFVTTVDNTPARKIRLFSGYKFKVMSGRLKLFQQ